MAVVYLLVFVALFTDVSIFDGFHSWADKTVQILI